MIIYDVEKAPQAIGPYSHCIQVGQLVFCSGQTPVDPGTMQVVAGGIADQTEQVLKNLAAVLAGVGIGLENVVKTTVFLKSMDDFKGMNEMYARMFAGHKPARSTIAVRQNPLDALVEIECIAEIPE